MIRPKKLLLHLTKKDEMENAGGGVQVLVASDAIGMGVNLNVRRIIFHALRTFNPENGGLMSLDPSHIKQIAGVPTPSTAPLVTR